MGSIRSKNKNRDVDHTVFMPAAEAMQELHTTYSRLNGLIKRGELRYMRITQKLFAVREDVARLQKHPCAWKKQKNMQRQSIVFAYVKQICSRNLSYLI